MQSSLWQLPRRRPSLYLLLVATLAAAIGLPTAAFSVLYGVLYDPLPYPASERLVMLWTQWEKLMPGNLLVGAANMRDWKAQSQLFEDMAVVRHIANYSLTGDGTPERLIGARATGNLFRVLGVQPILGTTFAEEHNEEAKAYVVVLSERLWKRRFGADPNIVGRKVQLNGFSHTVLGVMPERFRFPNGDFELWAPAVFRKAEFEQRLGLDYLGVGRLRAGVAREAAQSELNAISARLEQQYPINQGMRAAITPMLTEETQAARPVMWLVFGAAGLLMLLGCANIANLMLARGSARQRELSIRAALGASTGRIAWDLCLELAPVLLVAVGAGVLLAGWMIEFAVPMLPAGTPRMENVKLHPAVLLFAVLSACVVAVLTALLPAIHASSRYGRTSVNTRSTTADRSTLRLRDLLVVGQLALATLLLFGAGLLGRSMVKLRDVNPGFRAESALSLQMAIARGRYPKDEQIAQVCDRFVDSVRKVPGVKSAGMVNRLPMSGIQQLGVMEVENGGSEPAKLGSVDWRSATPGYFEAAGIPLLRGRIFQQSDASRTMQVGLIDQQIADRFFAGQDPVGKRMRIGAGAPWIEIVGVVGHIRNESLDQDRRPQVYWLSQQRPQDRMAMIVRVSGKPEDFVHAVSNAIHAVEPDQALYDVRPMEQVVERTLGARKLASILLGGFAGTAILLAAVGLYGVISFLVGQRSREFGIRMALGAQRSAILSVVLVRSLMLAAVGIATGVAIAAGAVRTIVTLLYGVQPFDAATGIVSVAVLVSIVTFAAWAPAWRASRIDPASSLRQD